MKSGIGPSPLSEFASRMILIHRRSILSTDNSKMLPAILAASKAWWCRHVRPQIPADWSPLKKGIMVFMVTVIVAVGVGQMWAFAHPNDNVPAGWSESPGSSYDYDYGRLDPDALDGTTDWRAALPVN